IPRPRSVEMSCNSRICEPCKVSEILAGACLVGRPAAAVSALLGFNTHLDLSDLLFWLVILTQPESPYLHFQVRPHASVYEFRHMDFAARQAPAWPRSISRSFMRPVKSTPRRPARPFRWSSAPLPAAWPSPHASWCGLLQIGRASCRERV